MPGNNISAKATPAVRCIESANPVFVSLLLFIAALTIGGCESSTKTDTNPPAAPTSLTAVARSSTTVELTWTEVSSNEEGFRIERKAGDQWALSGTVGANIEVAVDTALTPETSYAYRVQAYNGDLTSPYSNEATATTPSTSHPSSWQFASIPSGSFDMGSPEDEVGRINTEGPVHRVTFAQGFKMLSTEVTQLQWKTVMGADYNPSFWKGDSLPVEQIVSWDSCQSFLAKLNQLDPGKNYRLPSEAEWEYACRAGTTTRFYWGDDPDYLQVESYAWYFGNFTESTHPVATKIPNAWGLYDMCGNVWEWCEDDSHDNYNGAPTDGSAWVDSPRGAERTWRGGSIRSYGAMCRSARRGGVGAGVGTGWRGFRIVRDD